MARYIQVNACAGCKHQHTGGGFSDNPYKKTCMLSRKPLPDISYSNQQLGFTEPPEWCKLLTSAQVAELESLTIQQELDL